ncbi:MAG: UDP-N-acetylmuramoyl-L-alanyl-D-glutamate--2,6-diaminopimelate ligase, partial [Gammaproteobacteria bacterium]|nr:UDP-N-acetylmuramoyl-L-alanyl-D-glutamate--2,6-diaminopimelate ligase [Gammaproteobacteria bacterium]
MMAAMSQHSQAIKLKDLLSGIIVNDFVPDEITVNGIQLDSRHVKHGDVFIALSGQNEQGLDHAHEAINKGAVAIICDGRFDQYCQQLLAQIMSKVVCIPISDLQLKLGEIANRFYAEPSHDIFMVGVTGTDGKTSVSNFIAQSLNEKDNQCAIIGTIGNGVVGALKESTHTTPDVIRVHELLSEFRSMSVSQVAMEVSSHGLDQGRVNAVEFNVAVFTNLGRDHLDYHGDLDSYKNAKKKLFDINGLDAVVINLDDGFGLELIDKLKGKVAVWGYTCRDNIGEMDFVNVVRAENIALNSRQLSFDIKSDFGSASINSKLIGDFNVSNMLAVLSVMLIKGIKFDEAVKRLERLETVPGRMDVVRKDGCPLVVIDYAHTPQALESVMKALQPVVEGRLFCLFGCGGDRDTGKRALMAEVAEQVADVVVLTDDNPRNEDPDMIIEQIKAGFSDASKVSVVRNRQQAIEHVL